MRSSIPLYKSGFFSNRMMNVAVAVCSAVQISAVVFSPIASVFGVVPLNVTQWMIVAGISLVPLITGEIGKIFFAKKRSST